MGKLVSAFCLFGYAHLDYIYPQGEVHLYQKTQVKPIKPIEKGHYVYNSYAIIQKIRDKFGVGMSLFELLSFDFA